MLMCFIGAAAALVFLSRWRDAQLTRGMSRSPT
jgi:hypothetical protein